VCFALEEVCGQFTSRDSGFDMRDSLIRLTFERLDAKMIRRKAFKQLLHPAPARPLRLPTGEFAGDVVTINAVITKIWNGIFSKTDVCSRHHIPHDQRDIPYLINFHWSGRC
jgi:hypothetical protein